LIAVGSLTAIISKGRNHHIGRVLTAIGLLLLGLEFMKDSVGGIAEQFDINTLKDFSAWQFLLFGAIFAAVVQSSSATMIIALAALNGGIITLPSAAALAIGADLGTTSTIIIGASNGTPNKKRVAAAHVIFNVVTDLIAFALLLPLLALIAKIGIKNPLYSLVAFHSVFNLIGIVLFLPFIRPFARYLNKLFVIKKPVLSRYLHQITPDVTEAGLLAVRNETSHLIQRIILLNSIGFKPVIKIPDGWPPLDKQEEISNGEINNFTRAYYESKLLEGEILLFATDLQLLSLDAEESNHLQHLLAAVRQAMHSSKSIKDIQANLADFSLSNNSAIEQFSSSIQKLMNNFYQGLFIIKSDENDAVITDELLELDKNAHAWHDELHQQILQAIHKREIIETQGSSMLNVNREILNSNLAVIAALNNYHSNIDNLASVYVESLS
jgi:phosphate:Na+ symporter